MVDTATIRKRITEALREEGYGNADDIAFHMIDWYKDLDRLVKLFEDPNAVGSEEIERLLMDFLVHVPNHLAAASKLMLGFGVSDVFKVGAISDDLDESSAV